MDAKARISEPAANDFARNRMMNRHRIRSRFGIVLLLGLSAHAYGTTVTIHTDDARATLVALQNPSLTHKQAMVVAEMHGNLAVVRKLKEFKIPMTPNSFADALFACAHGHQATDNAESALALDKTKVEAPQLLALLGEFDAIPNTFQNDIERRISMFTPPGADIHLEGYVVAAGDGGGYAFGDTEFFLNIGVSDDLIVARNVTTHELYHAIQGAYAKEREPGLDFVQGRAKQACERVEDLFASVYEEGSARYVEDVSRLSQSHSEGAKRILADANDGTSRGRTSASLLEISVAALAAEDPVPFDDVYDVGFLGHGELYGIGYLTAKAIVDSDGPPGLTRALKEPPHKFLLRYMQLANYGADSDHPRLGSNTSSFVKRLETGCR